MQDHFRIFSAQLFRKRSPHGMTDDYSSGGSEMRRDRCQRVALIPHVAKHGVKEHHIKWPHLPGNVDYIPAPEAGIRITFLRLGQHRRAEITANNVTYAATLYIRNQHADAGSHIENPVTRPWISGGYNLFCAFFDICRNGLPKAFDARIEYALLIAIVLLTIVSARHGKDSPPWPITQQVKEYSPG